MTTATAAHTVAACKETGGAKYHAAVISGGSIMATKCNYSTIANNGSRRSFYATGSYVDCKRCKAAVAKEARAQA